jgi:hypothetical protein
MKNCQQRQIFRKLEADGLVRVIGLQDTMYIRRLSTLNMNVSFRTLQSKADKSALIDSGATDNFIDEDTWKRLGIGHKELA